MKLIHRVLTMGICAIVIALAYGAIVVGRAEPAPSVSRHYSLPATPDNVQWGWYDPTETPKLSIHSGDTVFDRNARAFAWPDQARRWHG